MKKIFSLLTVMTLALTFSFAQTKEGISLAKDAVKTDVKESVAATTPASGATMDFETKEIDYGVIEQNANGKRVFNFTNNGTAPLIITHAKGSCGCTVPSYPKEPIMPGETSQIQVKYDTKRLGKFTKFVTLQTNASDESIRLTIKGDVKTEVVPEGVPTKENFFGAPEK